MIGFRNCISTLAAQRAPCALALVPAGYTASAAAGAALAATAIAFLWYWLARRHAFLHDLFEQAPHAAVLTSSTGLVMRVNRNFTAMFGYTREDAVGRPLCDLIVPAESLDEYRAQTDLAAGGRCVDAEGLRRRADGGAFPVAIRMTLLRGSGHAPAVYTVFRDITEERRSREAQQTSDGRWRAIFENSAVGISVTDSAGRYIAANRAYRELLGYSEEELQKISYMDLTVEEDRPASAALAAANWSGKLPQFQLEKRYRRKDGQTIWVRITVSTTSGAGHSGVGVAIVEDITQRKRADARLLEYEKVVEGLPEMILVVDRDYRYLIANQAYMAYRGLDRSEVVGHVVPEMTGQEVFESEIKSRMDECMQGRSLKYELVLNYPAKGIRDISASYFPIEGPTGVDRVAMVLQDITEEKRSVRELQRSFQELHALTARLQNVREEERARLARELHDQLGQALTAIKIDLAALKNAAAGEQLSCRIDAILGLVDETIQSVRRIATELRPGILDDLGLVAAVDWAAEEFQARTGIECHADLPEAIACIDPECATAIFRIFQEALTNIARHAAATVVRIALVQHAGHLSLVVRDNGRGIQPAQLSASNSLGILGMRERALLLGGEFFVGGDESGTTVRINIPLENAGPRGACP